MKKILSSILLLFAMVFVAAAAPTDVGCDIYAHRQDLKIEKVALAADPISQSMAPDKMVSAPTKDGGAAIIITAKGQVHHLRC